MLLKIKEKTAPERLISLRNALDRHHVSHCVSTTSEQTVIGLEKALSSDLLEEIERLGCVEECLNVATPFKLASRAFKPAKTRICIQDVVIGGDQVILMAGPCGIESEEQLRSIANELKKARVSVLRGSAFKPRTSPYSFQGMGVEGLKLHQKIQKEHGLLIETEVMDV